MRCVQFRHNKVARNNIRILNESALNYFTISSRKTEIVEGKVHGVVRT